MSVFIVSMPPAVFNDKPPESNTTPLPTSASLPARARRRVLEAQKARRTRRALAHTEHTAHTCAYELGTLHDLHRQPGLRRQFASRGRDVGRRFVGRRLVHEVACPTHCFGDARAAFEPAAAAPPTARERRRPGRASTAWRRTCSGGTDTSRGQYLRRRLARRRRDRCRRARRRAPSSRPLRPSRRGARATHPYGESRSGRRTSCSPMPTSTTARAFTPSNAGTASISSRLPSNAAPAMKSASEPSSASSTTSAPGPSLRPANTGTKNRSTGPVDARSSILGAIGGSLRNVCRFAHRWGT